MINIQDLKIHYGEFVAVNNLSFSVKPGSVFGLIGPNGAGKTTTIKAIATLIDPLTARSNWEIPPSFINQKKPGAC